ncbi:glycosyltransferase [Thalassobius sp. Cn5-15]|uniref:glycosyltransferase n=1 Tax=Thalassobius sp. Cn5-15 TaxID=2917763 RepID=UPI001EF178FC|nr:glycosyltransferase [Thalassobius sp. Cn5-15]MCG7494966.1 glycosyltransferase [Thalassobius sp. Cn5-15]
MADSLSSGGFVSAPLSSDPQSPAPLISVIVPLYNVAAYVGACLASLRAQRFEAFEVIVVDDGSSDDSVLQAEAAIVGDARFRLIRQTHRGLGAARNAGLNLARGAFIAFVDSDDRVTPEYLQQMHQALVESGADWVACAIAFCEADGRQVYHPVPHSGIHGQADRHRSGQVRRCEFGNWGDVIRHFPSAWNKLYRRDLIGDVRFPEGTWFEDHGFFARLAAHSDHILHLAMPLYVQTRGRAGQITAADSDQVFEQFQVLDDLRGVICDPDAPHQGGAEAFGQIASRLLFERSTALRDPVRRRRYVQAAADYLARYELTYQPEWDSDISRAFGVEMTGEVPLSVVIPCLAQDPAPLQGTLASLARQPAPGREVVIACDSRRAARMARAVAADHPEVRVLRSTRRGVQAMLRAGLREARGRYICLLVPGDVLPDQVLHTRVDSALRSGVGTLTATVLRVAPNPEARIYARGDLLAADLRFERAPPTATGKPALRQAKAPSPQMLGFPVLRVMGGSDSACFAFEAVFAAYPYANLSFYDRAQRRILFHLSLRQEEGKVVCNHRGASEPDNAGLWGREVARPLQLSEGVQRVEVRFTPKSLTTQIAVYVDGQRLFRFGGMGVARRFRDLDQISYVDFQGGISPAGIDMFGRNPAPLSLNHRLEVRGVLRGDFVSPLTLTCAEQAEALAVSPTATLRLPLPGRWWQGVAADAPLMIKVQDGHGTVLATLTLSRADLARRLEDMLCQTDLRADPLAAMQALEHLRFAGEPVQRALNPEAQARVQALQQFYRLTDFLPLPPAPAPHGAASPPDPVATTQARLIARLRAAPEGDALSLLPAALAELPADLQPDLYLALVEYFCDPDQDFDHFYAGFAAAGYADHFTPDPTDLWQATSLLPLLLLAGRDREVKEVLWALAKPGPQRGEGWIVTPALGFLVRRALAEELPEDLREAILYAVMDLVEGLAERSAAGQALADRAHCLVLTETAVQMITQLGRCPHYMRQRVLGFVIRIYGLSRQFWQLLADQPIVLPTELEVIRAAFDQLQKAVRDPAVHTDLDQALDLFTRWDNRDVAHLRRDLFGPAGLPAQGCGMPDPASLRRAGLNAEDAMLRHMAFPHGNEKDVPDPSAEAVALTARAVTAAYTDVPRAPYYEAQMDAAAGMGSVLAKIAEGEDPGHIAATLDALTPDLARLSGPRSHYLGLGLSLGLIRAVSDHPVLLDQALAQLTRLTRRLTAQDQRALARAPAPALAARALQAAAPQVIPRLAAVLPELMGKLITDLTSELPPGQPTPNSPLPRSPLYDCIVTVFSCRANLATRIPLMRDGWLSQLAARNIPYVIVVGDKDVAAATRNGDILTVPAPDDYEGLPQKTLATLRWVQGHTPHAHMLKIDDDCFLNVEAFFHSLSYRKFDYYGRVLQRQVGQMDRSWHMAKSTSQRGRMALDKSPEPATYADGGSGYTLSRRAIIAALEAARSPAGQALIQCSFMEDKLLGDLLSLRGIAPVGEDYRITIRRRMVAEATPVPLWMNSFAPSQAAPVKLVHLDRAADQIPTLKGLAGQQLHPKKIWPTAQVARLGYQSNALELISPAAHLQAARSAEVAVVAVMRNEMFMLPRFLDHYRRLGVTSFLIADNGSDDGTLDHLLAQPDVALFSVDTDYRLSQYGVLWQQAMMAAFRTGKWSLVADADELLVWQHPGDGVPRQSLPDLLCQPNFQGAEAARVFMLDMYPRGALSAADFSADPFAQAGFVDREPFLTNWAGRGPFSNMPTWTSALRHRLIPGSRADLFVAQKIALLKYQPWMRLSAGLHFVGDVQLSRRELLFGHFKYNADFHRKAAAEVTRGQHFNNAEEYRAYLALIAAGRDVLYQPKRSVPWYDAPFVKARLGA